MKIKLLLPIGILVSLNALYAQNVPHHNTKPTLKKQYVGCHENLCIGKKYFLKNGDKVRINHFEHFTRTTFKDGAKIQSKETLLVTKKFDVCLIYNSKGEICDSSMSYRKKEELFDEGMEYNRIAYRLGCNPSLDKVDTCFFKTTYKVKNSDQTSANFFGNRYERASKYSFKEGQIHSESSLDFVEQSCEEGKCDKNYIKLRNDPSIYSLVAEHRGKLLLKLYAGNRSASFHGCILETVYREADQNEVEGYPTHRPNHNEQGLKTGDFLLKNSKLLEIEELLSPFAVRVKNYKNEASVECYSSKEQIFSNSCVRNVCKGDQVWIKEDDKLKKFTVKGTNEVFETVALAKENSDEIHSLKKIEDIKYVKNVSR